MDHQTTPVVLCVDDDLVTLDLMALCLSRYDLIAIPATGSREALKQLDVLGSQVALIFVDLAMPGISGFELASAVRQRPAIANIPIVAITARNDAQTRERAALAGIDLVLSKPFHPQQLVDVLIANEVVH